MKHYRTNVNLQLTLLQFILFLSCMLWAAFGEAQFEWRTVSPFPSPENINDVQFIDDNTIVAIGWEGLFMISKDGGINWERWDLPEVSPIGKVLGLQVAFADANTGYASFGGGVFKTNSGGEVWTRVGEGILLSGSNNGVRAEEMQLLDVNTVFIVQPNKAHKTLDGGVTWTEITPSGVSQLSGIHFLDANNGYIVTDFDGLYVTSDGGTNWTEVTSFVDDIGNTITRGTKIQFLDANTGWILLNTNVSNSNGIAVTTDGGSTWTRHSISGGLFTAKDMLFTSSTDGRILDSNKILVTNDGGQSWSQEAILLSNYNQFSLNTSENRMIMGGGAGALQWYDPVGVSTQLNNSITTGSIRDILFIDDDNGFILDSDQLQRTSNGGVSWFSIDLSNYFDLHFPTSSIGYAIGNFGDVQKTTNGGFTWSSVGNVGSTLVNKCFFIDANTGWVIGQSSLIYVTTDGGVTWNQQTAPVAGVNLSDIQFVNANVGYAGGSSGNLFKTVDGGSTWTESNFTETHFVNDIQFLDANTGWIGTGNRVWYTTDGGDNWTVGSFPFHAGINSIEFLDASTGFAASGGGRVFKTTDGGLNWDYEVDGLTSGALFKLEVLDIDNMWAVGSSIVAKKSGASSVTSIGIFVPDNEFCEDEEFVATFVANGDFNEDNIVSLEMSDEFGSFSNPNVLATFETENRTGSILATIPNDGELSANYRFRVVSSDPMIIGDDNGQNIQIGVPSIPTSFVTSSNQVCENTSSVAYEVPEIAGVSYNWNYSGTGATIIGSTHSVTVNFATNATSGTLSVSMENNCGIGEELTLNIAVDETTNGGSAIGGVDVCAGTSASQLSVTGHVGSVLRWEKAVSPFTSYETIPGSASTTLDPGLIDETTRFRAIIQSGACAVLESSFTTVDIADESEGGTVFAQSGVTEIVAGASPGNLINTGRTGSVVRWEQSVSPFTSYTPISSTSGIYNPGSLDVTTRFRAVVQNSNCDEDPSEFLEITVLDQATPQIVSFSPDDEDEEQSVSTTLSITFNEAIQSTGISSVVNVLRQSDDMVLATVDLSDPAKANFSDDVLTMTLSTNLPYLTQVYITVPSNGIEDLSGNAFAGFSDNETWDFETEPAPDFAAPMVLGLTPANGATGVALDANLEIEFDEDINLDNDEGTFELRRKSPDQLVEAFDIFGSRVSGGINSSVITIDPTNDLVEGVAYYFLIGNDVIIDNSDNPFAGFLTPDDWSFSTGSVDATAPTISSISPAANSTDVPVDSDFVITFTEDVQKGSGDIGIHLYNTDGSIQLFDVNSSAVSINGNVVTIDPPLNVFTDQQLWVSIPATAFEDLAGNKFGGINATNKDDWNFTTSDTAPNPPTVASLQPSDGSVNVTLDAALSVTFSENIRLGANGATKRVFVQRIAGGSGTFQSIDLTSDMISENTLTIPHNNFEEGVTYQVLVNEDVIADMDNNSFLGISQGEWAFTTLSPSIEDQTITFDPIADKTFGDAPFDLTATASSSLDVDFSVVSGPISINGNTVTIDGAGTAVIAASQAGNDDFNPANEVTESFEIAKAEQVISIVSISDKLTTDAVFDVEASVDSDLELTYQVTGPATISGTTITLLGTEGTVTVTVSQDGDDNYNAASESISFEVIDGSKEDQMITFEAIPSKVFGDPSFDLTATASSGLDIVFTVVSGPISITGNTVTITGAGMAIIAANQSGNDDFNPAIEVTESFEIAKAEQVISIELITDKATKDDPFNVEATVDSGLELTYKVSGPATISGTIITLGGTEGTVTVTVSQDGNDNYNAASESISFEVIDGSKEDQTITFEAIPSKVFGDPSFDLTATASSGLDIVFTVVSGPISITGNTVTITGAGTAVIAASQAGNDDFNPAIEVTESFEIAKAEQVISIGSITDKATKDDPFNVEATVDSGLELTYKVSGPATISGTTITLDGTEGIVTVTVSQSGNDNYRAASETITFMVTEERALSVDEKLKVSFYPNPVQEKLRIDGNELLEIKIYNLKGKLVKSAKFMAGEINVSNLTSGTYLIQINSKKGTITERLIKVN